MRKRASSAEPPAALRHARVERELYCGEGFRVLEVDLAARGVPGLQTPAPRPRLPRAPP
ncbi:hypothetical protein [Calidithermus terrae]|uniref:hypothetical protein n=1 Tax=Calidithermus terrae TaxID=1408545 RepID=UPI00147627F7|nr:hypothetical protein [Calidithermus terrae]